MSDAGIDRSRLPIRRPQLAGTTKRTLEGSAPDWSQASHVQPPEGAPNVLLVLIDDAGFGMVGECSGPFPGYNATIPRDCAPFPRMLQENGYLTAGFGKSHLTPDNQQGFSGAFDRWPTRLGFDYFRGFLGGEAGQYDPLIAENQKIIGVPEAKEGESYYFQDDLADKTIDWLHKVRSEKQKTPWFAYVATGCSHATASPS